MLIDIGNLRKNSSCLSWIAATPFLQTDNSISRNASILKLQGKPLVFWLKDEIVSRNHTNIVFLSQKFRCTGIKTMNNKQKYLKIYLSGKMGHTSIKQFYVRFLSPLHPLPFGYKTPPKFTNILTNIFENFKKLLDLDSDCK